MFRILFAAHCGMSNVPVEYDDGDIARAEIAKRLRRRRNDGHIVTTLEKGKQWEIGEPEDSIMVPDTAGILTLEEYTEPVDEGDPEDTDAHQYGECSHCGENIELDGVWMTFSGNAACADNERDQTHAPLPAGFFIVEAPDTWASYLINGDASGLEDGEQAMADAWEKQKDIRVISAVGEPYFTHHVRVHVPQVTWEGGNLLRYVAEKR